MTTATSPTVGYVQTSTIHAVHASISGADVIRDHMGRLFLPGRVELRWMDGVLTQASVRGVRVTASGDPYANGATTARTYLSAAGTLLQPSVQEPGAPAWLQDLVNLHAPAEARP